MELQESLYLVTGNVNKLREFQCLISSVEQFMVDLPEIQSLDPREVIEAKLRAARERKSGGALLVEDTSLELACYGGLPGTLVKWFEKQLGIEKMAEQAAKLGNTAATARTIIGLIDEHDATYFFEGIVQGDFVLPRGEQDFGWGPAFQPVGMDRTFGEMTREEKDRYGMRGQAIRKLVSHIEAS